MRDLFEEAHKWAAAFRSVENDRPEFSRIAEIIEELVERAVKLEQERDDLDNEKKDCADIIRYLISKKSINVETSETMHRLTLLWSKHAVARRAITKWAARRAGYEGDGRWFAVGFDGLKYYAETAELAVQKAAGLEDDELEGADYE